MKTISIPTTKRDTLAAQLVSLYGSLKGLAAAEPAIFNFKHISWTCPLLVLPISAYINATESTYNIDDNHTIKSYLDAVRFPKGVDSVSSFEQQVQAHKTYIPISVLRKQSGSERERLETQFTLLIPAEDWPRRIKKRKVPSFLMRTPLVRLCEVILPRRTKNAVMAFAPQKESCATDWAADSSYYQVMWL